MVLLHLYLQLYPLWSLQNSVSFSPLVFAVAMLSWFFLLKPTFSWFLLYLHFFWFLLYLHFSWFLLYLHFLGFCCCSYAFLASGAVAILSLLTVRKADIEVQSSDIVVAGLAYRWLSGLRNWCMKEFSSLSRYLALFLK